MTASDLLGCCHFKSCTNPIGYTVTHNKLDHTFTLPPAVVSQSRNKLSRRRKKQILNDTHLELEFNH